MCPFCLASMGLVVAGAVSTAGLAALALTASQKKNGAKLIDSNSKERSSEDVNQHDREPENSVTK